MGWGWSKWEVYGQTLKVNQLGFSIQVELIRLKLALTPVTMRLDRGKVEWWWRVGHTQTRIDMISM